MYLPEAFAERDLVRLGAFVAAFPLGLLIAPASAPGEAAAPQAHLVPFEYAAPAEEAGGAGVLRAHVARANPVWRDADGADVLVVFQGPQAYVSPGWYASKREHGRVVPTWNYAMVQARGTLRAVHDAAWIEALLRRLTERHEAGQPAPWSVDDAPRDFVDGLVRAVVGIEIPLRELTGKWKLSQNRAAADVRGVVDGLAAQGADAAALARFMAAFGAPNA